MGNENPKSKSYADVKEPEIKTEIKMEESKTELLSVNGPVNGTVNCSAENKEESKTRQAILLDMDYVMISYRTARCGDSNFESESRILYPKLDRLGHDELCTIRASFLNTTAVSNLDWLLAQFPEADLILESAWRVNRWKKEDLRSVFSKHAFSKRFTGCIPDTYDKIRDITTWRKSNPDCSFVILDDDLGLICEEERVNIPSWISRRIVWTDPEQLLTRKNVELAKKLLLDPIIQSNHDEKILFEKDTKQLL